MDSKQRRQARLAARRALKIREAARKNRRDERDRRIRRMKSSAASAGRWFRRARHAIRLAAASDRMAEEARRQVTDARNHLSEVDQYLERLIERGSQQAPLPPVNELARELIVLEQQGAEFDEAAMALSMTVGPFTLTHQGQEVALGTFQATLDILAAGEGAGSTAWSLEALEPNEDPIREYVHPHINLDGEPCLGEWEPEMTQAVCSGRLLSAFDVLSIVLSNYGAANPYQDIRAWLGYEPCEFCEQMVPPEEIHRTQPRERMLCEACCVWCEHEDEWVAMEDVIHSVHMDQHILRDSAVHSQELDSFMPHEMMIWSEYHDDYILEADAEQHPDAPGDGWVTPDGFNDLEDRRAEREAEGEESPTEEATPPTGPIPF